MKFIRSESVGSPPTQCEQACIRSLRSGNTQALDEFYLLHRRDFIRWAHRVFGLEADQALDVYQDAILILYENISRNKLGLLNASLKTYFFAIGKNLIRKGMVDKKNTIRRLQAIYPPAELPEAENLPDLDAEQEKIDALLWGLECLTGRNQSILKLFYYHRLSHKAIAQQLGYESEDVVKNQKVRCVKYLRKLMEGKLIGVD